MTISKEDKEHFELKILAESLFKNKKKSYAKSVGPRFVTDRLDEEYKALRQSFTNNVLTSGENIKVKINSQKDCNTYFFYIICIYNKLYKTKV